MIDASSKWFRRLLLTCIYVLGVLGIVGSGGGGGGGGGGGDDDDCSGFNATVDCVDIPPTPPIIFPEGGRTEGFDNTVNSIAPALDASDDVYVGGDFTIYKNSPVNRIARLNNDGSLDTSFITGTGFNGEVRFIAPAIDGSGDVYVGGYFTNYNGTDVRGIARLNLDGTLDTNFIIGTGFNGVVEIISTAIDGIGDVYVGGGFTSYNGTIVGNGLIRLNDDGSLDSGFSTGSGWGEGSIAPSTDGSGDVYVARSSGPGVARLNNDGSIDAGFDTGPSGFNDAVRVVVAATDGSGDVYAAGSFNDYNGTGTTGIVRLNSNGSLDMGFVADSALGSNIYLMTLAIDGSGDVYINARDYRFIDRLNNDGTRDTGFDTNLGFFSISGFSGPINGGPGYIPNSVALATDGSSDVYVVGGFTRYNFTPAARIARLTASGAFVR